MASWRIRQSYGFGAARVPLAPVFTPSPFSGGESLAIDLGSVVREIERLDPRWIVHNSALAVATALGIAVLVLVLAPAPAERDAPVPELVLIESTPEDAAPLPDPVAPLAEPAPPLEIAEREAAPELELAGREPVPDAQPEPPAALPAKPEPPAPPRAELVTRPAPPRAEPVTRPAPQQLRSDAIAKAPAPRPPAAAPPASRAPAPKPAPSLRIDAVAPRFAVAATPAPAGAPSPLRAGARAPARAAPPVKVGLAPIPAAPEPSPRPAPIQVARLAAPSTARRARPNLLAQVEPVAPPAHHADVSTPPPLVERPAGPPARESASSAAPRQAFRGVPLGSLAACVSDREEDALKLEVMAAAGARSECASRAGHYRFVETRNLNAFLMWIERNPSRRAVDRCIELRLALECLAAAPNGRTDNG